MTIITDMDNSSSTNLSFKNEQTNYHYTNEQKFFSHSPHNTTLPHGLDLLNTLTWVSCGLTCLACLCTVMIYIGYRLLQSSRCMLRISFLAMLCTTEAFFVAGMKFTELTAICTAMAAILHFSCIATFSWLLCYILFLGNELKGGQFSYFLFAMIGYVVPACIVVITLIWHYTDYRDDSHCWISSDNYLDWTLKGPIVALTLVCLIVLIHVAVLALNIKSEKEKAVKQLTRSGVRACCVILPVTSATWILGAFTVTDRTHHSWLQATFTGCNLLLGLVIFLFMCVFNGEVKEVRRLKHMGSESAKKRQQPTPGSRGRRGVNMIDTAVDRFRIQQQTPQPSPRREHYRPLADSGPDPPHFSQQAAPLASVEDVTMGSTEVLDLHPLQRSEPPASGGHVGGGAVEAAPRSGEPCPDNSDSSPQAATTMS